MEPSTPVCEVDFDDPDEFRQRRFERRVADRELEHLVVRGAERVVAAVLRDVVALDEDPRRPVLGRRKRLEHQIDENFFRRSISPRDSERHAAPDKWLAGAHHAVEDLVDALPVELRDRFEQRLADEAAAADEVDKGVVGDGDLVIGHFEQRHEAGRLLEHPFEALLLAAARGHLVQHELSVQQCRRGVTAPD